MGVNVFSRPLETSTQFEIPQLELVVKRGHGFFINLLMTRIGGTITCIGKKSLALISPRVCFSVSSANCDITKLFLSADKLFLPLKEIGWHTTPRIMSELSAANLIMSPIPA